MFILRVEVSMDTPHSHCPRARLSESMYTMNNDLMVIDMRIICVLACSWTSSTRNSEVYGHIVRCSSFGSRCPWTSSSPSSATSTASTAPSQVIHRAASPLLTGPRLVHLHFVANVHLAWLEASCRCCRYAARPAGTTYTVHGQGCQSLCTRCHRHAVYVHDEQ